MLKVIVYSTIVAIVLSTVGFTGCAFRMNKPEDAAKSTNSVSASFVKSQSVSKGGGRGGR